MWTNRRGHTLRRSSSSNRSSFGIRGAIIMRLNRPPHMVILVFGVLVVVLACSQSADEPLVSPTPADG